MEDNSFTSLVSLLVGMLAGSTLKVIDFGLKTIKYGGPRLRHEPRRLVPMQMYLGVFDAFLLAISYERCCKPAQGSLVA